MPKLGNDTIFVIRAPLVASTRGNEMTRDWSQAVETKVENCSVQPTMLSDKLRFEIDAEREYHMSFFRIYAPPGTDIVYTDRVKFQNKIYDVQGASGSWRRMSGIEHHVAFLVKLREG